MAYLSSFTNNPGKIRAYGLLVIFSLGLLALGYYLEQRHANELLVHFTNELGIAGLVGFFLAITIEELSHAEFRKVAERERAEIKKDVFYYVYGHEIPLSIRDEIDAHILRVPYVRRRVVMRYELEPIQDSKTSEWYVLTTCTMSYDLENLTTGELKFPFNAAIDKSPSEEFANYTRFIELSVSGCKKPFKWDEAALKAKQKDEGNEFSLKLPEEIVLLPKQSSDGAGHTDSHNLTHVTLTTETVRFLRRGHIDFIFTSHVCDLELTVWADRRLNVTADTGQNPLEPVPELPSDLSWFNKRLAGQGRFFLWKLKKPLLAYQTLQIFWTPQGAEFDKVPALAGGQPPVAGENKSLSDTH